LDANLVPVDRLSDVDRAAMLALMTRFYDNVCPRSFAADLSEKRWVIQVRHPETGELCGFSTQMLIETDLEGRPIKALFSGDTIIDEAYWGEQALPRAAVMLAWSLIEQHPGDELYWFLLSQGYKTYRFLPLFFHEFYPRHDDPTPAAAQGALDALARFKYPTRYDPRAGVIRASADQYHLRRGVAEATPQRQRDPHVRFFLERNVLHAGGDELCCIAPLTSANLTPAAKRFLRAAAPSA
jgi:hypothetical protein